MGWWTRAAARLGIVTGARVGPGGVAAAALLAAVAVARPAQSVELAISCGALGIELRLCTDGVRAWERKTGNRVEVVSTPNSSNERLALYQQLLSAQADDIDVLQIDVVWPGVLASHLVDLSPYLADAAGQHFATIIANNTVDGRLLAMPWWTDAGLLFYRSDLLEKYGRAPPESWPELAETARLVQEGERAAGHPRIWGFVWQGRAYEGLFCNALEWLVGFGGGTVIDAEGHPTIANPGAEAAFAAARSWVGTISPRGVLNYDEEAARGVFQAGHAVFMRNWPYAWALAQGEDSPVRNKVGVAPLPPAEPGGVGAGTLGGWNLAVSRYSRHPAAAADLVRHLTGAAEQKRRAVTAAYNPTIPALYEDADILRANPFYAQLRPILAEAVARPSRIAGRRYARLSSLVWRATHDIVARGVDPGPRLERLAAEIRRLARRSGWGAVQ
ncbi:sugar ABC transporter substrate-binding protein [Allostella sp. ATCC 35155]|nr:sugar ABC transporter substrate-binding protein [Stella sp. ATCC 35155]